ncbi:MAG: HAMP domain-containing histidine kinase, partial [Candidatus Marinimicrobia bacterium]|nr:HAMP domain-containing histidine kinase [Candidatus Neomarinimicrobiota bacterium]
SDDKQVLIEIRDTGSGIEKSQLDYVFDPFFTTKEEGKGTGLGLSICYSIIKEHRGNITIESKVGIGTKVAVTIPYV